MRLMYLGSQAAWQGVPTLLRALALALEQAARCGSPWWARATPTGSRTWRRWSRS